MEEKLRKDRVHPIVGREIRLWTQSAGPDDPVAREARHRLEGIQRDQAGRIPDEKSVKMLYSHAAGNAVLQRGLAGGGGGYWSWRGAARNASLLSAISDHLRENNLTLTLNAELSEYPRASRHFRYPVISLLAGRRERCWPDSTFRGERDFWTKNVVAGRLLEGEERRDSWRRGNKRLRMFIIGD